MATRHMDEWQTSICQVISDEENDDIIVRGHRLDDLIDDLSFSAAMYLMLQGSKPTKAQTRVLDALLVASIEHGIAPPSMVARCFASYGTSIQAAVGGGIISFGDRMGGLGEQLAKLLVDTLADLPPGTEPSAEELRTTAEQVVAAKMALKERVPGYGIPLHGTDPRAPKVLSIAKQQGTYGKYCAPSSRHLRWGS